MQTEPPAAGGGARGRLALGRAGEEMARQFYAACGFACVAAGLRTRYGEIDLIVARGALLVFVEVKTRRGGRCGAAAEAVTAAKLARLRRLAGAFLASGRGKGWSRYRFDVVAVEMLGEGRGCRLDHLAGVGEGAPAGRSDWRHAR